MNTRILLCVLAAVLAASCVFAQDGGAAPPQPGPAPGPGPGAGPDGPEGGMPAGDPMETLRRLFKQVIGHMERAERELGRASAPETSEDADTVERIRSENEKIEDALDKMNPPGQKPPQGANSASPQGGGGAGSAGESQARTLKTIEDLMKAIQGEQAKSSESIKKLIREAERMQAQQSASSSEEPQKKKPGEKDKKDDQLTQMPQDKDQKEKKEPGQPPRQTPPGRPREETRRRRDSSAWIASLPEKELEELARSKRPEALKKWNRATEKYHKDLSERAKDER